MQICKSFRFEAAHVLPHHPGKCSRLHGHSYRLDVYLEGALHEHGPAAGMVEDFGFVAEIVEREIIDPLDHSSLNDYLDNPTAENIVIWAGKILARRFNERLVKLVLWETPTACAVAGAADWR